MIKESTQPQSITVGPTTPEGPLRNRRPQVIINRPSAGFSPTKVTFEGSAKDVNDGDLSTNIRWSSDIDGVLGVGATVEAELTQKSHTITASVTDSGGLVGRDSITLDVAVRCIESVDCVSDDPDGDGDRPGGNKNI